MSRRRVNRWTVAPLLGGALAVMALRRKALSPSGALAAAAVGTAVFGAGGLDASTLLLLFFGSSTALSRVPHPRPLSLTRERGDAAPSYAPSPTHRERGSTARYRILPSPAHRERARAPRGLGGEGVPTGPRRTLVQVLANGGLPSVLAVWNDVRPSRRLAAAYAGALAAANADTWATEIGARSRAIPRSIVSGRPVERGVSGGVTPLGTTASLAGALLIGAGYAVQARRPAMVLRLGVAGLAGSVADSVLGATLQVVYRCQVCHARTEDRTHTHGAALPALILVRGLPAMTNDMVNLCASLVGAVAGAILCQRP